MRSFQWFSKLTQKPLGLCSQLSVANTANGGARPKGSELQDGARDPSTTQMPPGDGGQRRGRTQPRPLFPPPPGDMLCDTPWARSHHATLWPPGEGAGHKTKKKEMRVRDTQRAFLGPSGQVLGHRAPRASRWARSGQGTWVGGLGTRPQGGAIVGPTLPGGARLRDARRLALHRSCARALSGAWCPEGRAGPGWPLQEVGCTPPPPAPPQGGAGAGPTLS